MVFVAWLHLFLLFLSSTGHAGLYQYTGCNQSNDYLEGKLREPGPARCIQNSKALPAVPGYDLLSMDSHEMSCIAFAMYRFSERGVGYAYKNCSGVASVPVRMEHRPCISENYVRYMYERYKSVSRCALKGSTITQNETFPLFSLESGFHVNITSGSGCRGIGQLSKIAVQEMDALDRADEEKFQKPYTRGSLQSHAECAEFEKNITGPIPDHSKKLGECEVISLPENPELNLLYSLRLYRMLKDEKAYSTIQKNLAQLKSHGLTQTEIDALQIRLARIMYNGGYPAIQSTFNTFMKTLGNGSLAGDALWNRYTDFIYSHYPATGEARRKEVRDYVGKIEKAKMQIEQKAERPCF
jgi:hypothetical protein